MEQKNVRTLLEEVRSGSLSVEDAVVPVIKERDRETVPPTPAQA